MEYTHHYDSPLGTILLSASSQSITGLWFEGQRYFAHSLDPDHMEMDLPVFDAAIRWLDLYFSGEKPDFTPALSPKGTLFQKTVWELLQTIPYGQTVTYGLLAEKVAEQRGLARMSAQAVGGAVSRNPISLIIPCHRVIAADGSPTGYAGGIDKKIWLLQLEQSIRR